MNPSRAAVCDYRGSMTLVFDPDFRTQASEDTTKPSSNQLRRWTTRRLRSTSSDGDPSDAKPKHRTLKLTCKREQMNPGSARSSVWSCCWLQVLQELPSYEFRNDYDTTTILTEINVLGNFRFLTLFFSPFLTYFWNTSHYYIILYIFSFHFNLTSGFGKFVMCFCLFLVLGVFNISI